MKRILLYCSLVTLSATAMAQDMNYYLVLGSFKNAQAAEIFADEMNSKEIEPVEVSMTELDGGVVHRVVHGPFSEKDPSAQSRLADLGIDRIWWLIEERPDNRLAELAKRDEILLMSHREYAIFCVRGSNGERTKYCNDEMLDARARR